MISEVERLSLGRIQTAPMRLEVWSQSCKISIDESDAVIRAQVYIVKGRYHAVWSCVGLNAGLRAPSDGEEVELNWNQSKGRL